MAKATFGQVDVTLGGETLTLKPTLDALTRIERRFGSVRVAAQNVADLQLDAVVQIIAVATNMSKTDLKELPEAVFAEGIVNVVAPVSEFLMTLLNPAGDSEESEKKK